MQICIFLTQREYFLKQETSGDFFSLKIFTAVLKFLQICEVNELI